MGFAAVQGSARLRLPEVTWAPEAFLLRFLSQNLVGDQEHLTIQVSELEEEVSTLRKINKNLFDFSARIITKPAK